MSAPVQAPQKRLSFSEQRWQAEQERDDLPLAVEAVRAEAKPWSDRDLRRKPSLATVTFTESEVREPGLMRLKLRAMRARRPRRHFYPAPWTRGTLRGKLVWQWREQKRLWDAAIGRAVEISSWPDYKRYDHFNWQRYDAQGEPYRKWQFWRAPGFVWHPTFYRWVKFAPPLRRTVPVFDEPARAARFGHMAPVFAMPNLQHVFETLAETTTTADPGSGGTSLAVTSRSLFNQTGKFYIVVQDSASSSANREIMRVTGGQGTGAGSFTVVRGQEGTTAVAHTSGSYVAEVLVGKSLDLSFRRCYVPDYTFYTSISAAVSGAVDINGSGTPLQAATDDCNSDGGGRVVFPGFGYLATQHTPKTNVLYAGEGIGNSGLVTADIASSPFAQTGSTTNATTLSVAASEGDRAITVSSATGYAAGDWVEVDLSTAGYFTGRVRDVAGSVITLEEQLPQPFPITTTNVREVSARLLNSGLRDMTLSTASQEPAGQTNDDGFWVVNRPYGFYVRDVEFIGYASDGSGAVLAPNNGRQIEFRGLHFDKCYSRDPNGSTQNAKCLFATRVVGMQTSGSTFRRSGGSKCCGHSLGAYVKFSDSEIGGGTDWDITPTGHTGYGGESNDSSGRGVSMETFSTAFTIADNEFHDEGFDGVRVDVSCDHGDIATNQVFKAHDMPLYVTDSSYACVTGNIVNRATNTNQFQGIGFNNTVKNVCTGNSISNTRTGIWGDNCTDSAFSGNNIDATTVDGYRFGTSSTRNTITGGNVNATSGDVVDSASSSGLNRWSNVHTGTNITTLNLHADDMWDGQRRAKITSNVTTTGTGATNVTGLQFYLEASRNMHGEFVLYNTCGTGGTKFAITFPSGATLKATIFGTSTTLSAFTSERMTTSGTLTTAAFNVSISGHVWIKFEIRNSTTGGSVQLQFASVTSGQTSNVEADSHVWAKETP